MSIKDIIKWVAIIALVLIITALSARVYSLEKRLKQRQDELQNAQKSLEKSRQEYMILSDKSKRDEQSLEALVSVVKTEQNAASQRLECVESSNDAHDWLDDPLPDSVRMCFGHTTTGAIPLPDAPVCDPGTLRQTVAGPDADKP